MATNGTNGIPKKSAFNLETCARPNILALKPYRCARDDYKDDGKNVLLDANENAYGPGLALSEDGKLSDGDDQTELDLRSLHRYPDPHQHHLKSLLCSLRNDPQHGQAPLTPSNLFVGNGSDEAIDALLRCFCVPGRDKLLTCPPTYGMYAVSAQTNDVEVVIVPLVPNPSASPTAAPSKQTNGECQRAPDFSIDLPALTAKLTEDPHIKLIYLTSPGNPTASLLSPASIEQILSHDTWNGILALDEAYIDFSAPGSSLAPLVTKYPNLVVLQTLSKAFGLAGIRLGAAFASEPVARILNNMKPPYNVSELTSQLACRALTPGSRHLAQMTAHRDALIAQRTRLVRELPRVPGIGRFRGGLDANFVLVEVLNQPHGQPDSGVALRVYERLAEGRGVVVRFRGKEHGCEGCLRVTVGTEGEVTRFLREIKGVLEEVYGGMRRPGTEGEEREEREEVRREVEESGVVA